MTAFLLKLCRTLALPLVALAALVAPLSAAHAAPCTANCLTPGDYTINVVFGGLPRVYLVHVPASYDGSKDVPLVIDFHGGSKDAWNERDVSGQLQQSDKRGFIVAYPNGIGLVYNGTGCCLYGNWLNIDDVGFAKLVVAQVKARAAIDRDRVFATGISNGGSMAHRMACEAADIFRAAAPVSYTLNTDKCTPSRPIGVTQIFGGLDTLYQGQPQSLPENALGLGASTQSGVDSFAAWKRINGCTDAVYTTPLPPGSHFAGSKWDEYRDCAGGVRTGMVVFANAGHVVYNRYVDPLLGITGDNAPVDVAEFIWDNVFNL